MSDGPFCFGVDMIQDSKFANRFNNYYTDLKSQGEALTKLSGTGGKDNANRVQGILISEESYSFILTFVAYNNATEAPKQGILVDRVIESDFQRNRKIIV